jgi:hypothetical protein
MLQPGDTLLVVVGYDPERRYPPGVDRFAYEWASRRRDNPRPDKAAVDVEPHPADWRAHPHSAGHLRNSEMVILGAEVALVFCLDDSSGTTDCLIKIQTAKINHIAWRVYSPQAEPRDVPVQQALGDT